MENDFLGVLHKEEILDNFSLDTLKGGQFEDDCTCNNGSKFENCPGFF